MRAAYEEFQARGFEILSVSLDSPERMPADKLKDWIDENGMTWRHVYDGGAFESPLARAFHVKGIPSMYLIGPDGELAAMAGELRGETLLETVRRVLEDAES